MNSSKPESKLESKPESKPQPKKKNLKQTMLIGAIVTALAVFTITLIAASQIFTQSYTQQSVANAKTLSQLSFDNMYQLMSKGWSREQLLAFRADLKQTYEEHQMAFSIYRSQIVNDQFGYLASDVSETMQPYFREVLRTQQPMEVKTDDWVRSFRPLIAQQACLQCHTQAQAGAVLGIMGIEQNIGQVLKPARNEFVVWMLLLMPIPVLLAIWVGRGFSKSLLNSVHDLNQQVLSINQIDDLKNLAHDKSVFDYAEFDQLNISLNQLGDKIKNIAIDRDILDFEIQLLDKLVLSSEIVKDWKQHICVLMEEINQILPLYSLFVVFRTDDIEHYVIEVFWLGKPDRESELALEESAKETLAQVSIFEKGSVFKVHHTYATTKPLQVEARIQTQSKSLILETPKIGGVVGLGVKTLPPKESSRSVVVESILTTLVNVIGSIKAINKFTKDLEYYATRDPLTHLFNQRLFHELLMYEVERAHRHRYAFGLMLLDFDNFKLINDRYGHAFGDEVLRTFALSVKEALREGDIFARYGGDEFCVIFPETAFDDVYHLAQGVQDATHGIELIAPNGDRVHITCSIGISMYPDHAKGKEDLFMVADNMLYRSKGSGKNVISYPDDSDLVSVYKESNDQSLFILQSLETGEPIEPNYQPIVTMETGEIEVHELLMRLRQDGELISAGRFIETAEHMGLVNQMDMILIDKALAQIQAGGYQGILFINLSPKAIVASEFIQRIIALTETYAISHDRIVFEITERETVHNIALLEKFVRELRLQGFRFAIDDFGSGFSSFQYLKRFPVDFIKIEGEFINNMSKNKIDLAFVESAVSMAKSLGIKTIAEFIENTETLDLVKQLGIDYAQGYLLATPQPEFIMQLSPALKNRMVSPEDASTLDD